MTTVYAKYPDKKKMIVLHKVDAHPKMALQKYLLINNYSKNAKNVTSVDSGYHFQLGEVTLMAY